MQQLLRADGKRLARLLLREHAYVCVCGSGGMAASAREAFDALLREEGALEAQAAAALQRLLLNSSELQLQLSSCSSSRRVGISRTCWAEPSPVQ